MFLGKVKNLYFFFCSKKIFTKVKEHKCNEYVQKKSPKLISGMHGLFCKKLEEEFLGYTPKGFGWGLARRY